MVSFDDAVDICFDLSGHDGTVFNLLHEPFSGLIINGEITDTVFKSHHAHRLAKIGIISPQGGMVAFNTTHIETFDNNGVTKLYKYERHGFTDQNQLVSDLKNEFQRSWSMIHGFNRTNTDTKPTENF